MEILEKLGMPGRMVAGSKSGYCSKFPRNLVVFNSNLCTSHEKIWYGDIDITKDRQKLREVSESLGMEIYVLYEMDGRFENENDPKIDRFVYKISPDGKEELGERIQQYVNIETMELKK